MTYIRWFDQLKRSDVPCAGGKGANLGEMFQAGLPVPPGYVVTVDAYRRFAHSSGIGDEIASRLAHLNVDDPTQLRSVAEALQGFVHRAAMPDDVCRAIVDAYAELSQREQVDREFVAVRSSATVEDTAQFSFAGMFQSFLNVRGPDELVRRVKDCWASLFGARVLFYRIKQGLMGEPLIAVIVEKMVNADKSGVLFTVDPATNDPKVLVIEAAWGLGEVVVSGEVTPDRYEVAKDNLTPRKKVVGHKDFKLVRDERTGETVRVNLSEAEATAQVLSEAEVRELAELGKRDAAHYHAPQDAEWAIEQGKIYFVQTRPITTLAPAPEKPTPSAVGQVLVRGLGASPGLATGMVRVLLSPDQAAELRPGEVLVTTQTSPDWVPVMRRAAAIVTDTGGMTSHAAIVSRELGIPCIVGTRDATKLLREGVVVTVNAREGTVVAGARPMAKAAPAQPALPTALPRPVPPVTATRLYVNLGEPDLAEEVARQPVDGVGLIRAEFMLLAALDNTHPRQFLQEGRGDELVARMAEKLKIFARAFYPRPVVYRTMDFRTNEFRNLKGGQQFEPEEANPMIGFRGCYRYVKEPELFRLELRAIKEVREQFDNLQVMIPFVRTGWEFRACKALIDESGLTDQRHFGLWIMAEVPSVVSWLPDYVRFGVTGVSIGSNDLTQLILGVDRDNPLVAPLYDERDRAVMDAIHRIIQECRRLGITSSICGQAPSVYPEYVEPLVRWGVDSISVNTDVIEATRRNIAAAEQSLLLATARERPGPRSLPGERAA
ncbi:MAG TPA: phosphoenolpyruvate synthase [Chloroflexota bacterium]|nr:phosphoenolpyruvate synthase [Chloroflexota bacterium]